MENTEPKKNPIRARNKLVNFRVSEAELERLKSKIEKSKLTKEKYLRNCALEKDIIVIENLRELILEVKKIGNNINQITKAIHNGSVADSVEFKNIESQYNQVFNELLRILKKV